MDLTRLDDLRTAMRLAGIKANKSLGQHFLIDRASLELIVKTADLSSVDTVLEIGPGLGVLTTPLTAVAGKVIAVERDPVLAGLLRHDQAPNLEVVEEDALTFDLRQLPAGYKVVANIPYYLTSRLFRLLLESGNPPKSLTLLIQREVAQRICAGPGKMSLLALSVQYYGQPKTVGIVERHKFWPAPEVDSAIIQVECYPKPFFPADQTKLFRLMKAGFGERRKQLKNSLSGGFNIDTDTASEWLSNAKISSTARAQELSLGDWRRLYEVVIKTGIMT